MEALNREQLRPFIQQPLIPLADNFTPRERTPWGGTAIANYYKKWLNLPTNQIVGESWEISGHPSFPNRFVFKINEQPISINLPELLDFFPEEILGKAIAKKFHNQIPLLVKFIDTAENLSVQVHPNDGYRRLKPGEMGKTEAWYIIAAQPGCGLYLGLRENVTRQQLERAIKNGEDVSSFLNFVPVQPGEIYFIPAGTIHAIGKGITLIEPQQTSETTYRFWDWNRRYNERGEPSADGKPRPLHLADSFAVTNFNTARGNKFINQIKGKAELIFADEGEEGNQIFRLLLTPHFVVEKIILASNEPCFMMKENSFQTLTMIKGEVELTSASDHEKNVKRVRMGQSVLLPAIISQLEFRKTSEEPVEIIRTYYPIQF